MSILGWADRKRNQHINRENQLIDTIKNLELFHFTDKRNLPSIKKFGLLGWETLENSPYNYKRDTDYFPGADKPGSQGYQEGLSRFLDKRAGYTDSIRLSGHRNHYMTNIVSDRGLDIVFLKIDSKIIFELDCEFSNVNATRNGAIINDDIHTFLDSPDPHAEVLVKHKIDKKYIIDVVT